MKQVDAFIITSTRAPGKTRKAWYQYILVCEGHTKTGDACVRDTTGHRLVLECAVERKRKDYALYQKHHHQCTAGGYSASGRNCTKSL